MIRLLALSLLALSLVGCAGRYSKPMPPEPPQNIQALTAPTQIEGSYKSSVALAKDPASDGDSLTQFALQAESAVRRCNIDKASLREYIVPAAVAKCPWYHFGKCH